MLPEPSGLILCLPPHRGPCQGCQALPSPRNTAQAGTEPQLSSQRHRARQGSQLGPWQAHVSLSRASIVKQDALEDPRGAGEYSSPMRPLQTGEEIRGEVCSKCCPPTPPFVSDLRNPLNDPSTAELGREVAARAGEQVPS